MMCLPIKMSIFYANDYQNHNIYSVYVFIDNTMISDMSLRALGKVCRDLCLVYLAGCSRITDHGMKALGTLRQLQKLNVADCIRYCSGYYGAY